MEGMSVWNIEKTINQKQFYQQMGCPIHQEGEQGFVIISDALRFESAAELRELILQEDRYTATLNAVLVHCHHIPNWGWLHYCHMRLLRLKNKAILFTQMASV